MGFPAWGSHLSQGVLCMPVEMGSFCLYLVLGGFKVLGLGASVPPTP